MRFNPAQLVYGLRHLLPVSLLLLAACSSGGGGSTPAASTYSIGGSISGLSGTVVLQNNGGNNLSVSANGPFVFTTKLADGAAYTVTVLTQPAGQICTASSNTGTVAGANVTSVAVTCAPISAATYTVGGNVTGLTGTGLVLQNNAADNLSVNIDGSFTFSTAVADGAGYAVTVLSQPAGQTCTVTPGSGSGTISGANVSSVAVNCTAITYNVRATVTGIIGTVQLRNNGIDLYNVSANGTYTFPTPLTDGASYNVTAVVTVGGQTCTASNNTGIISGADVTATVTCSTNTWTVGGTTLSGGGISGLVGSVTLLNNGNAADPLTLNANGDFVFTAPISQGSGYNVTVSAQPANQLCTVTNGIGFNVVANITTVKVTCVNTYTIGGTIVSVSAPGSGPTLQNNGGDTLVVGTINTAPGTAFTFSTPIPDGSTYAVSQLNRAFAPTQDCVVTGGDDNLGGGTVAGGNVASVVVTCTAVSPIPKFAYVTNSTANTVSAYAVTYATGALGTLTPSTVATGLQPNAIAVDPSGSYAYVVNYGSDTVSGYRINATSGALTQFDANGTLAGLNSATGGDGPVAISIHPSGLYAYVVNQGVPTVVGGDSLTVFSIDPATGVLAVIDASSEFNFQQLIGTGAKPNAVAIDSAGRFLYVANSNGVTVSAYTIDQTNGALTSLGTVATGTEPASVAIDPNGNCALVANAGSDSVSSYTINQTTGALTAVSTVTAGTVTTPRSVAIDPSGLFAYTANAGSHDVSAYSLAPSTCAIAAINADAALAALTIPAGLTPISVSVDPSGTYVYVVNFADSTVSTYSIDANGALTVGVPATTATGTGPTSFATAQ